MNGATCSVPITLTVPTIGVTSTVDRGTICVDGVTSCRCGVIGSVATPVTVAVEGDTTVEDIVLAPVTMVVVGEITDVDSVVVPSTVVMLGVTENSDTVEYPVTEVLCTGTVTEDGKTGPTTIGLTTVPMAADVTMELTNMHNMRIQPTLVLQP